MSLIFMLICDIIYRSIGFLCFMIKNIAKIFGILVVAFFLGVSTLNMSVVAKGSSKGAETIEEPGENPGGEWDGKINDPATPIPEPQPQPRSEPVSQPVSESRPVSENTRKVVTEVAPEQNKVELVEDETKQEALEEQEEVAQKAEETETIENKEENVAEPEVLVPETAHSENERKIRIMALVSTGIVVFAAVFTWAFREALKIYRYEKIYKEAVIKSAEVKKMRITRAG